MTASDPVFDYSLNVRYGEVGPDGRVTLSSLAAWLQEAAGHNALSLGFGEENMSGRRLAWILTRMVLRIRRLPGTGESIRVRTWPSSIDRFAHRGYEVYDGEGALIVSSGSAWSLMDTATRRLGAMPPELSAAFPTEPRPCDEFTCRVLPRLPADSQNEAQNEAQNGAQNGAQNEGGTGGFAATIQVRRDDRDIHRHVNNAHYLSWLLEALPDSALSGQDGPLFPRLVDLTFRAECFPGEKLLSVCAPPENPDDPGMFFCREAPFRLVHAIRRIPGNQEDVCRGVTYWTRPLFP
jgi:acyl-ACP thioesterase